MFELIEKLRQKSDRSKKRIAFLGAFLFSGIIFVVWLSVIYPDFLKKQDQEKRVAEMGSSPTTTFMDTLTSGFSAIGDQVGKIREAVSSLGSSDPTYYVASPTQASSVSVSTTTEEVSTTTVLVSTTTDSGL